MAKYEEFLNELVILEKKYLLYSRGHDFVNQAALDLLRTIGELHGSTPSIRIVDTGFSMIINDVEFSVDNLKVGYLTHLFSGRGINSVTFHEGVGFSAIMDFLYLLNSIPNSSKLLYHTDIQYAIHNIDSIQVEEIDYGRLSYGNLNEVQDQPGDVDQIKIQLYESLKPLNPNIDSCDTDELIDIALDELSKMSQTDVPDFIQGLSDEVISEMIARVKAKENSISPSLIDLLVAMDTARKLAGHDSLGEPVDGISHDQVNKLVEREAYELYVTEDYRQHLRSLLAYDGQSMETITEIDMFDKTLINRTIVTALIQLTKAKLDSEMHMCFVDSIHSYLDQFIDDNDWQFIQSLTDDQLVCSYIQQDSTVLRMSEAIRGSNSYRDNHLEVVIQVSGHKNLYWLMDDYIKEENLSTRRGILSLIQSFQETAAIHAVRRLVEDPTIGVSRCMPIIKGHSGSIPKELTSRLHALDSADAKLLAIRILLTQNDEGIRDDIARTIQNGESDMIFGLLDLIREFKITELIGTLLNRIRTFYIDDTMFKFIVKTIDTVSSIDYMAYEDMEKKLMRKRITLSPKNLRRIRKHLKGVSHEYKPR